MLSAESVMEALSRIETRLEALTLEVKLGALPPRAYKYAEAGRLLGCSPRTVKRLIKTGELRAKKIGGQPKVLLESIIRLTSVTSKPTTSPEQFIRVSPRSSARAEAEKLRLALKDERDSH